MSVFLFLPVNKYLICLEATHALTKFPGWHPAIFVYEPLSFLDKGTEIVSMVGSR